MIAIFRRKTKKRARGTTSVFKKHIPTVNNKKKFLET